MQEPILTLGQNEIAQDATPRDIVQEIIPRQMASMPIACPTMIQAVLVAGTSNVSNLAGRPFTLYELHVPLLDGESVAFRRFSDFIMLDRRLGSVLGVGSFPCLNVRMLPPLPPRTRPWQDRTASDVILRRWGALQLYLDAALELISRTHYNSRAWEIFREFLCIS